MGFELKILGANSAKPSYDRNQTAQLLTIQNELYLIDCGEGTQLQLNQYKVRQNRIKHILISHLHGDHFFGLIGLLSTMHLHSRNQSINIYAPPQLAEILTLQLKVSGTILNYKINFVALPRHGQDKRIFENDTVTIDTVSLIHRIPCYGFIFKEKLKPRRIRKDKITSDMTPLNMIALKKGEDVTDGNGKVLFKNEDYTLPPKRSRSYAYCSDTLYHEPIIKAIKGVDLLYHESTFLQDKAKRAKETYHSTAKEAALIAKKAKVTQLIIGHYSSRYKDITPFLNEAKTVFDNTLLAIEGETIYIEE